MIRLFVAQLIRERDALNSALKADQHDPAIQAWHCPTAAADIEANEDGPGWLPQGKTGALLDQLRPRAGESELDHAYRAAVQAVTRSPAAPYLMPKLEAARRVHEQLLDGATLTHQRGGDSLPFLREHCSAIEELRPFVEDAVQSRSPSDGSDKNDLVVGLAALLDLHHKRTGFKLGRPVPTLKGKDMASQLGVGPWRVNRAMRKLLKLSGEGQTPQNAYCKLATTGKPRGSGLAEILADLAGDARPHGRGRLSGPAPDVNRLTPDQIAMGQEFLDSERRG